MEEEAEQKEEERKTEKEKIESSVTMDIFGDFQFSVFIGDIQSSRSVDIQTQNTSR